MKLSILICHVQGREDKLERLMKVLRPQLTPDVEVLIEKDDRQITIGAKRNLLLSKARGMYVCFVDDDDLVPDYYVAKILEAMMKHGVAPLKFRLGTDLERAMIFSKNPDCIGFRGHYIVGENVPKLFVHSLQCEDWYTENNVNYRCPNHLNPIKRDLATQTGYPNKSFGEDIAFSRSIRGVLKTEVMIEEVMYYYYEGKF